MRSPNPAYMHPADLTDMSLLPDDCVEIRSRYGIVTGFVAVDPDLRRGVVVTTHGFRPRHERTYDPHRDGANVNQLLSRVDDPDRYHGLSRMGGVPIGVHLVKDAVSD